MFTFLTIVGDGLVLGTLLDRDSPDLMEANSRFERAGDVSTAGIEIFESVIWEEDSGDVSTVRIEIFEFIGVENAGDVSTLAIGIFESAVVVVAENASISGRGE